MWLRYRFLRVVGCLAVALTLAAGVFAGTIRLKDGGTIKGRIASFNNGTFVIEIGQGSHRRQLTFNASEIESIVFDAQPSAIQTRSVNMPATYTKPQPPPVQPAVATEKPRLQPATPRPQTTTPRAPTAGSKVTPIKWNAKVRADNSANGWTNSGWVVKKGQRIRITADGTVSLGNGQNSSPAGVADLNDDQKLLKSVPTGALLAVIGDDNNEFIYVGAEREFTASRVGTLFLGINEGNLADNSGAFEVTIEIIPGA